jgi:hypothetical protein
MESPTPSINLEKKKLREKPWPLRRRRRTQSSFVPPQDMSAAASVVEIGTGTPTTAKHAGGFV